MGLGLRKINSISYINIVNIQYNFNKFQSMPSIQFLLRGLSLLPRMSDQSREYRSREFSMLRKQNDGLSFSVWVLE